MVDLILELVDFNEGIDYSIVSKVILMYLSLLWVFVSVWVFNDARYRFNSTIVAFFLAFLNLFLLFPFLLIYLLIRPSRREDWDDLAESGGVSIPVVNFADKDGVVISLHLKIDSKKILDDNADYKVDISLNRDDDKDGILVSNEYLDKETKNTDPNKAKLFILRPLGWFKKLGVIIKLKIIGFKSHFQNRNHKMETQNTDQDEIQKQTNNDGQNIEFSSRPQKKKNKSKKKKRR